MMRRVRPRERGTPNEEESNDKTACTRDSELEEKEGSTRRRGDAEEDGIDGEE